MTKEECREAARYRSPVIANGIRYKRISAIVARYATDLQMERGIPQEYLEVELECASGNSVTITSPAAVSLADPELHGAVLAAERNGHKKHTS